MQRNTKRVLGVLIALAIAGAIGRTAIAAAAAIPRIACLTLIMSHSFRRTIEWPQPTLLLNATQPYRYFRLWPPLDWHLISCIGAKRLPIRST